MWRTFLYHVTRGLYMNEIDGSLSNIHNMNKVVNRYHETTI